MEYIEEMLYLYNFTLLISPFSLRQLKKWRFYHAIFQFCDTLKNFVCYIIFWLVLCMKPSEKFGPLALLVGAFFFSLSLILHISRSINNQLYTKVNGNMFTREKKKVTLCSFFFRKRRHAKFLKKKIQKLHGALSDILNINREYKMIEKEKSTPITSMI